MRWLIIALVGIAAAGAKGLARSPVYAFSHVAGSDTGMGYANGTGSKARFRDPMGIALDAAGNLLVADYSNHVIRKVSPAGEVVTIAGQAGVEGFADGLATQAKFNHLTSVTVDPAGNIYVVDSSNHRIRKITVAGVVSTLAGSGTAGSVDGAGLVAQFLWPWGIAIDGTTGTLYVADEGNHLVRRVTPEGGVTTLAGSPGGDGSNGWCW